MKRLASATTLLITTVLFPPLSLSVANAHQFETIKLDKNPQLVAINIPNFNPNVKYHTQDGVIELVIPQALLAAPMDQILRANEGRVKDTEFQKVDVRNMRFSVVEERFDPCGNQRNCIPSDRPISSGFRVNGQWQFQFREKIGCAFGKCHYTSWTSVSGTFSQPFYFQINNARIDLQPGGITIRGERWYTDSANAIAGLFSVHSNLRQNLRTELQTINGMDLRKLIFKYASPVMEYGDLSQTIDEYANTIKARVSGSNLIITIKIPVG